MSKIMIIGPCKLAIGGIYSIISNIKRSTNTHNIDILYVCADTRPSLILKILKFFSVLLKIIGNAFVYKSRECLFFSSAGASFWEKSLWCWVLNLLNIKSHMVMVDGNFPSYYQSLPLFFKKIANRLVFNVDIVAQSSSWAQYYKDIFNKFEVPIVTGGVDTDYFFPAKLIKQKTDDFVLLYVGWVIEKKGIFDLIEAIHIVSKDKYNFRLVITGPLYEGRKKIDELISLYGLQNIIEIPGHSFSRSEIKKRYQSADIFVFPSHFEGFPVALLESLSSGLPSIGTKVGGIPEMLDYGNCGLLVDPNSPVQLSNSILELMSNPSLMSKLKVSARKIAETKYNINQSASSYLSLFGK
jgi:glycosyltransferase involved in cell wall biosynthesis